jgi:hypothetical protein
MAVYRIATVTYKKLRSPCRLAVRGLKDQNMQKSYTVTEIYKMLKPSCHLTVRGLKDQTMQKSYRVTETYKMLKSPCRLPKPCRNYVTLIIIVNRFILTKK